LCIYKQPDHKSENKLQKLGIKSLLSSKSKNIYDSSSD